MESMKEYIRIKEWKNIGMLSEWFAWKRCGVSFTSIFEKTRSDSLLFKYVWKRSMYVFIKEGGTAMIITL